MILAIQLESVKICGDDSLKPYIRILEDRSEALAGVSYANMNLLEATGDTINKCKRILKLHFNDTKDRNDFHHSDTINWGR